jgi:hypothetical protein
MRRPFSDWAGNRSALAALIVLLALPSAAPAAAEKRIALIVANSAYQNIPQSDDPRNDAVLMAGMLSGLATQPGSTAQDGSNGHRPYTKATSMKNCDVTPNAT